MGFTFVLWLWATLRYSPAAAQVKQIQTRDLIVLSRLEPRPSGRPGLDACSRI